MLHNSIQTGEVMHRRRRPASHSFTYPIFMSLLNIEDIPDVFARSRLWSMERFNLVSFHRKDYIGGDSRTIAEEVKRRILAGTGKHFSGKIFMLAHLRYLGFCFNPVSFYFCYDNGSAQPKFILAEVNNTPWNERHCYVLDASDCEDGALSFKFDKQFHVSPFMPMELEYKWHFRLDAQGITVNMKLYQEGSFLFRAGLDLAPVPFSSANMRRIPLRFPFVTAAVVARIYWHALLLWLKRVPFHNHPENYLIETKYEHDSQ